MKKNYVMLPVTAGFILTASAQPFIKGNKLLGGSLSFNHAKYTSGNSIGDQKNTSFGVSPGFGVFTKNNQLIGFSMSYQHGTNTNPNQVGKYDLFGANVYKQYWNALGKEFYFIIAGGAGVSYSRTRYSTTTGAAGPHINGIGVDFSIDPGFAYRIKKRLILDFYYSNFLSAYYTRSKTKNTNSSEAVSNSFGLSTGLQAFSLDNFVFGFRYVL